MQTCQTEDVAQASFDRTRQIDPYHWCMQAISPPFHRSLQWPDLRVFRCLPARTPPKGQCHLSFFKGTPSAIWGKVSTVLNMKIHAQQWTAFHSLGDLQYYKEMSSWQSPDNRDCNWQTSLVMCQSSSIQVNYQNNRTLQCWLEKGVQRPANGSSYNWEATNVIIKAFKLIEQPLPKWTRWHYHSSCTCNLLSRK